VICALRSLGGGDDQATRNRQGCFGGCGFGHYGCVYSLAGAVVSAFFAGVRACVARCLRSWLALYRFRTRRRCLDLRIGRMDRLRQDRGLCPFA